MDTEAAPQALDPAAFDRVQGVLATAGPLAAADQLCSDLRAAADFQALFYARLMRTRIELGISPFPTGPAADLPPETHDAYEAAIRAAGREVGQLYLARRDLFKAWGFFRMLGEPEPVKAALDAYEIDPNEDTYGLIDIAWHQQVHPRRGFDIVLDRHGICSAITMLGGADLSKHPDLKEYCVRRLVRALHEQLRERVTSDLTHRGVVVESGMTVGQLLGTQEDTFAEDIYHIDVSHLSSVVQFALQLSPCDELALARELCEYGERLSVNLRGDSHPPFEHAYSDYKVYLDIVAGEQVEAGIEHFKAKLPTAADRGDTFPAEVLINLLVRIDRLPDAVEVAKTYLTNTEGIELSCPPLMELARRAGDFQTLAATARDKGDAVSYLAGLIAAKG